MVLHHDLTAGNDGVHRQILVHQQQVRIHAGRDMALFAFNLKRAAVLLVPKQSASSSGILYSCTSRLIS